MLTRRAAGQPGLAGRHLGAGYHLDPFYSYAIAYAEYNFQNPTYGAVFKQLYFRQALAYLTDQEGMSKAVYRAYAYPTTGPVPPKPANQFAPAVESANGGAGPYPFSTAKAKELLTSHGWQIVGGVLTCEVPAQPGACTRWLAVTQRLRRAARDSVIACFLPGILSIALAVTDRA